MRILHRVTAVFSLSVIISVILLVIQWGGATAFGQVKSLKIDGASNMILLMKDVASAHGKKAQVGISPASNGSGAGAECLNAKKCDVAFISEDFVDANKATLEMTPFALSPVQIIVAKSLAVDSLTLDQAKAVFTGKAKNWKEVGGPDMPIRALQRRGGTGITRVISTAIGLSKDFETVDAVQTLFNRFKSKEFEGAISYTSGVIPDHMKILKVDGVAPTANNVREGKYKMTQVFLIARHKDSKSNKEINELMEHLMSARKELFAKEDLVIP